MGTDALRFTLLVGSTPGNDINLSLKKVEANRNFANKIWNAGRFVIGTLENAPDRSASRTRMDSGRFLDLGALASPGTGMWSACSQPTSTAKPAGRFTTSSGASLPTGTWKLPSCKWPKAATALLHRPDPGADAGYLPALAASLHALCHRGTVGAP